MSPVHIRQAGFELQKYFSLPSNVEDPLLCNLGRGLEMRGSPPASPISLPNLEDIALQLRGDKESFCSSSPQPSPGKSLPPSPSSGMDYLDEREPGHEPTFGLLDEHMAPVDVYSCDDFRMFEFKVRRCMRGRSHDWTECPFAHPGEKARRRDPRKSHYSGTACPDFRKGTCRRGDACEYAHGVFECWLHPARYRTQACKDGLACKRRVCFFAHTREQLRVLPAAGGPGTGTGASPSLEGGMGGGSGTSVSSCSGQSLVSPRSASHCCGGNVSAVRSEGKGAMGDLGRGTAGGGSVGAAAVAAAMARRPAASRGLGLSVLPGGGFDFMPLSSGSPSPQASSPTSTLLVHLPSPSPPATPPDSSPEEPSSPRCQPVRQQGAQRGQWTDYASLLASAAQASMAMSGCPGSAVAAFSESNLRKQHLERLMSLPGIDLSQDPTSFFGQTTQQTRMAQMYGSRLSPVPQGGYPLPGAPSPAASLAEVIASLSNMDLRSSSPLWLQAHLAAAVHQQQVQATQMHAAVAEAAALASVQQARAAPAMEAAFMAQHALRPPVPAPAGCWPEQQSACARGMPSWEDAGSLENAEPRRVESGAGIRHRIFERLLHGQDSAAFARSPSDPDLNNWVTDLLRGA